MLLLTPLALLVRRSPESMGLLPDGDQRAPHHPPPSAVPIVRRLRETEEFTTRDASRTSAFWWMAVFHGLRNIPYAGVSVHLVPLLVWKGLDQPTAAFFVGLMAFSTVIVRPLTGWLGDRWSKQKIGAIGVILGGLGIAVLTYSNGALWHIVCFAILFSFGDGINSVTWALVGDFFGRQHFATYSRLDRHDSKPGVDASSGVHRLDLRPNTELHLRTPALHRHVWLGRPGSMAGASPQTPAGRGSEVN